MKSYYGLIECDFYYLNYNLSHVLLLLLDPERCLRAAKQIQPKDRDQDSD